MAVVANADVGDGLFVPFRTLIRGGPGGIDPVGTLMVNAEASGAAGGGTVTLNVRMRVQEFGFHAMWVPMYITVHDDLPSAEVVEFTFQNGGNERLSTILVEAITTVRTANASANVGRVQSISVLIDPNSVAQATILRGVWATNTDGDTYHIHAYGPVFDGEVIARGGGVSQLVAGLR